MDKKYTSNDKHLKALIKSKFFASYSRQLFLVFLILQNSNENEISSHLKSLQISSRLAKRDHFNKFFTRRDRDSENQEF
jgi:hypothetical protein